MNNVSSVSPAVNPTAAIRRPATMPKTAVMLGRARCPITGRFVPSNAPYGLQTVVLPTGTVAYRVGPLGVIYADLATAKRAASARRPGHLAPPEPVKPVSPVFIRGFEVPPIRKPANPREFGAGLGIDVDADDLRIESSYADYLAVDAMSSGHAYA